MILISLLLETEEQRSPVCVPPGDTGCPVDFPRQRASFLRPSLLSIEGTACWVPAAPLMPPLPWFPSSWPSQYHLLPLASPLWMTTDSYGLSVHQFLHKNWNLLLLCLCVARGRVRSCRFLTTGPPQTCVASPWAQRRLSNAASLSILTPSPPRRQGGGWQDGGGGGIRASDGPVCLSSWRGHLGSGRVPRSGRLQTQQEPHPN